MNADTVDLAWAAGLFEGEGCITISRFKREGKQPQTQAHLTLNMTDEDVVRRFHRVLGIGTVYYLGVPPSKPDTKPQWRWQVQSFENVQAGIALLWRWLGPRRRARAVAVMTQLKAEAPHPAGRHPRIEEDER